MHKLERKLFRAIKSLFTLSIDTPPPSPADDEPLPDCAAPRATQKPAPQARQTKQGSARKTITKPPSPCESQPAHKSAPQTLKGKCYVIDGDTIVISKTKIRLFGIDAPELDHPFGNVSKYAMVGICKGQEITATVHDHLSYDRVVATCCLPDGTDIAAELVKRGLAIDWPKYSDGVYRHLETDDARKKMWRAAARQRGRMV